MTFKFSRDEFNVLYDILKTTVELWPIQTCKTASNHAVELLIRAGVLKMFQVFHNKSIMVKKQYRITLSEQQCIAFWLQYNGNSFPIFSYEATVLRSVNTLIDQQIIAKNKVEYFSFSSLSTFEKCILGIPQIPK